MTPDNLEGEPTSQEARTKEGASLDWIRFKSQAAKAAEIRKRRK